MKFKRLLEIPAQTAAEFVQELGQLAKDSIGQADARLPLVVLGLKSGRTLSGYVLNTSRTSLSFAPDENGNGKDTITFLSIDCLETVTSPAFREVMASHLVPLKPELRRRAEALGHELGLRVDLPTLVDEDLRCVNDALTHCSTVLKALVQDERGRASMASRIKFVELTLENVDAVSMLGVTLRLTAKRHGRQTGDIWQSAIEKLL